MRRDSPANSAVRLEIGDQVLDIRLIGDLAVKFGKPRQRLVVLPAQYIRLPKFDLSIQLTGPSCKPALTELH
jgi:hypothetical protein